MHTKYSCMYVNYQAISPPVLRYSFEQMPMVRCMQIQNLVLLQVVGKGHDVQQELCNTGRRRRVLLSVEIATARRHALLSISRPWNTVTVAAFDTPRCGCCLLPLVTMVGAAGRLIAKLP